MRSPTSLKCKPNRHFGAVAWHNRALRIMRKRQQNVERQTAERGGGVELLGDGDEADRVLVEAVHEPCEIEQRPAQPVNLIYNHAIEAASLDVFEQLLQARPIETAAAEASVVVLVHHQCPAQLFLAFDIGFGSLALRMKRIDR